MSDDSISGLGFCCATLTVYTDVAESCAIVEDALVTCTPTYEDVTEVCNPVMEKVTCA